MALSTATRPANYPPGYWLTLVLLVQPWMQPLSAAQVDFNVGYRAEYSDNINRANVLADRIPELVNSLTANLLLTENTGTLIARIVGDAEYNKYYHGTYGDDTIYSLDAYVEAFLREGTFSWVAADGFSQLIIDPLVADTPANRTDSNSWETGPNVYLRFSAVDTLQLEGRYGQTRIDFPELSYQRIGYASRWLHRTSPRTVFSLNYEWLHLDYDFIDPLYGVATPYPDLNRHRLYLRTEYRDAGNLMSANIGWTQMETVGAQQGAQEKGAPLIYLALMRQPASTTSYGVRYRHEFSDVGGELLPTTPLGTATGSTATAPTPGLATVSQDPFLLRQFDLFHNRTGGVFPSTLQFYYRDTDYLTQPDDMEETGVSASVRYEITPTTSIQLQGTYQRSIYWQQQQLVTGLTREDRDSNVGILLAYRFSPNLRAGFEARRFERRSTWEEQGYTDDRFALTLMYQIRTPVR